jgi:hypothetical protein
VQEKSFKVNGCDKPDKVPKVEKVTSEATQRRCDATNAARDKRYKLDERDKRLLT